jgi:hypothetical protein
MKNKLLSTIVICQILSSCNFARAETPKMNSNQALLNGSSESSKNTVQFRSLDKGPLLFDDDYNLPTSIVVEAGEHELSIMCEFHNSNEYKKVPGQFKIIAKENKQYLLMGKLIENGTRCHVDY